MVSTQLWYTKCLITIMGLVQGVAALLPFFKFPPFSRLMPSRSASGIIREARLYSFVPTQFNRHHALEQWGARVCHWGLLFERMFCDHNPARLSESRFGVAGPLSRFDPLWFFSMGILEIPCLCKPSKNPTRFEDQHPGRNCQHSACYAGRSNDKCQKSVYSLYGE